MLKKTIKYTDYNGEEREEDFHFHMTLAQLTEMELEVQGGLGNYLKKVLADSDNRELIRFFKEFIQKSYGKKSEDGRSFLKSEELVREFEGSEAYSELFLELISDANKMAEFFNGIMPANFNERVDKLLENQRAANETLAQVVTQKSTAPMTEDDLKAAFEKFRAQQAQQDQ